MATVQELRYLCLLAAASGLAQTKSGRSHNPGRVHRNSMRCVLYMVLAFSLRRGHKGRRNLRTAPANPNAPQSSRLRYSSYLGTAFRARLRSTVVHFRPNLPHKRGCLAITYM